MMRLPGLLSPQREGTLCVHTTGSRPKLILSADGRGVVSHAGPRSRSRSEHQRTDRLTYWLLIHLSSELR